MTLLIDALPPGPVEPASADLERACLAEGPASIQMRLEALWGGVPLRWAVVRIDASVCRIEGAVWRRPQP